MAPMRRTTEPAELERLVRTIERLDWTGVGASEREWWIRQALRNARVPLVGVDELLRSLGQP